MKSGTALFLLALSTASIAQGDSIEIMVTGSRIVDFEYMPAVTINKDADYLVQEIRLLNDSRSKDLRRKEIIETVNNLLSDSKSAEGIELSYGKGFLVPISMNDDALQLDESSKRDDSNYLDIVIKVALDKSRSSKQQISELRAFIDKAKVEGRTEIESRGDIGLTIINPEQYRYNILKAISAENVKIKHAIQSNCKITISGLESRVEWERSGISQLTLYIPYALNLDCD